MDFNGIVLPVVGSDGLVNAVEEPLLVVSSLDISVESNVVGSM